MHTEKASTAAVALLLIVSSANAITVSGPNPNSSSYVVSASSLGSEYSGVAELMIVRSDLGPGMIEGCSGALLSDGVSILTSADCVADHNGVEQATTAYVTFNLPSGIYMSKVVSFHVDPAYNGSTQSPNDVAVLTLAAAAPSQATDGMAYPFGTLRVGENQYSAGPGNGDLLFHFDDGTTAHDALTDGFGQASEEAFLAPGDSGGPSFINGETAGVHAFVGDIDGALNSSFGEYAGAASVADNWAFIESLISTPEPRTMFLVGVALIGLSMVGPKRKHP